MNTLIDANDVDYPADLPGWMAEWSVDGPEDSEYRYTLWRPIEWTEDPKIVNMLLLNPSTATELNQDPTLTRCTNYAEDWGYDALCVTNLFAYRATDPGEMKAADEPAGPDNDEWILRIAELSDLVVLGYGAHGDHRGREKEVRTMLVRSGIHAKCLDTTDNQLPRHPLYLPQDAEPHWY